MIDDYLGNPSTVVELKSRMAGVIRKYGFMLWELQEEWVSGENDHFPRILALEQ